MEIVVHDNTLKTVAVINNDIPMLPSFFNDNWHRYKDQGAETFIFTVNKFINGQLQDYCRFLNEQAYISFTYDGIDHLFGVENVQESDYQITLTCSSLNLELRNEQANALVNTSSHNIQWYFDQMGLIENAQITIGANEVSSLTRTINYDGQESKLARLISVIGNFDAEFEFITHLNDDGTLDSIILNIYRANDGVNVQGVGTNRNDVSLNFGKNISGITRTGDTTNLFNATTVTGSDNLNWNSSSFSYKNEDGVEEFYKRAGSDTAFAPLSLNLFKSQIKSNDGDKWIRKDFQTEYTNVNDMWGYCVSQFKQFAYPTVTYEVLANSSLVLESVGNDRPLSIGDTINIQDDNFMDSDGNVGLLLSARVSEMEISFSNPTLNKITFSNFKKQQSEASADIQAIVNQLVDAATPYIGSIDTTNGTQFKNGTGSTTLSAHIFKGSATNETIADSYEWSKDGTVVAPTQTIIVDASGVADKAVYYFKATIGGKAVASQSVTITNINDGTDGKTSYTHVAWANNITGTDGFTTVYPNLNLIEGTKDFSGTWSNSENWTDDGTYKGLTVKKRTGQWGGIYKSLTIQTSNSYTFSAFVKGSGTGTTILRFVYVNGVENTNFRRTWTSAFDWVRDSITFLAKDIKVGDEIIVRYEISVLGTNPAVWTAGHKWEQGSAATPYIPSASEVITADWPSFIGQYSDFTATASTDPAKYAPWTVFKGIDGNNGRGVVSIEQKYQLTQTSAKPVDAWDNSVWQTTQPTTTSTNKYLWSITRTTFNLAPLTQDIVEQKAVYGDKGEPGDDGTPGTPGTSAINIDLSNKSYNFLANLEVSDSGSVMQAVAGSTTTTFTALQGTAAINITALTCTTTLPTGMTVSIGTLNALSVVVTISVDNTMITPNGGLNFSITAGGVTTTKSFSYSLAINDLTVINLAAINSNLGNVKNIYSNYNGSDGGTYSGTIEINDENIKITATNDNDSNEVSKTQMNGENGIWHSTKLQKTNSPGVYFLSNWSLTGTTLSFESQQSDLTYPNGYSYASYGIDMHARNIVGDSISQTTDVPWTDITRASGVGTSGTLRARINNGVFYAQSKDVTIPSIAPNSTITIGTMSSKFSIVSGFDTLGLLYSPGQLSVASVTVGNDRKINIGNPNPTTMSGKVIQFSINIPLG
ncbi:phage tail protein [Lactococcus lactis]|uniref:phage tail protein n=1 Tax=Lactococcus lactis TaxID=1358 RepID=UPI000A1FC5DC|nr:phage tail protein [Lactococcus lactis]OSP86956.1 phage tail protein [Lactococcus lactis]